MTRDTSGVLFAVVVLLVALIVGFGAGGSLDRLGSLSLRNGRLVVAAVVVQLGGGLVGGAAYPLGLAVSAALVAVFLAHNRGVRGTGLVALGLLANALVVGLNGAMPVSREASGRAGITTQDILSGADPRHELSGPGTRLALIGDVIPVLLPVHPEVVSVGDVLVAAGLAQLLVVGMTRRRRLAPDAGPPASPAALDAGPPASPAALDEGPPASPAALDEGPPASPAALDEGRDPPQVTGGNRGGSRP